MDHRHQQVAFFPGRPVPSLVVDVVVMSSILCDWSGRLSLWVLSRSIIICCRLID